MRSSPTRSPEAYAKLVDRLLASPHYGERWGRYWLDVARYAEDQAHTFGVKPNTQAYRYRDWGHRGVQRGHAVRPLREAADRGRSGREVGRGAAEELAGSRLLRPRGAVLQEFRCRQGRRRRARRPRRHADARLPWLNRFLRPVPRSQVRSDPAAGLLLACRHLLELQDQRGAARSQGGRRQVSGGADEAQEGRRRDQDVPEAGADRFLAGDARRRHGQVHGRGVADADGAQLETGREGREPRRRHGRSLGQVHAEAAEGGRVRHVPIDVREAVVGRGEGHRGGAGARVAGRGRPRSRGRRRRRRSRRTTCSPASSATRGRSRSPTTT